MSFPEYAAFHAAVFGQNAFHWQSRLAELAAAGEWPEVIDVPTGLGKSMVLPIAVWALARQTHHDTPRTTPQRIMHVVDRRRVIDQSHDRMVHLAEVVNMPSLSDDQAAVEPVRAALAALSDGDALLVDRIHGDSPDSGAWLRPAGCSIIGLTPQQAVSRLLFRGLGVSARTRSIHAGLLGVDCLWVMDEPHLSHQAVATVEAVLGHQARAKKSLGLPPARMVLLGATVPSGQTVGRAAFALSAADLTDPPVKQRLTAPRPVRIVRTKTGQGDVVKALVDAYAELRARRGPDCRIAIMVNTVAVAVKVRDRLSKEDPVLLTSRLRATDRQRIEKAPARAADAGMCVAGPRDLASAPCVVATQCIEVGVDIDFDVIVTEACPYPALLQRLGRLNRAGLSGDAEAVLVAGEDDQVRAGTKAVYEEEPVRETSRFLESIAIAGVVDLSLEGQAKVRDQVPSACWPTPPRTARFHAGYLGTMAHTYPTPTSDIPLDAFISGPEQPTQLDVLVAWRDDLEALQECAPLSAEFVAVPLPALASFLQGRDGGEFGDVPVVGGNDERGRVREGIHARVRRDDLWKALTHARELRPGDQIVVDRMAGGYESESGWRPAARTPVPDHSAIAASMMTNVRRRSAPTFPLSVETLQPWLAFEGRTNEDRELIMEWLATLPVQLSEGVEATDIKGQLEGLGLPAWDITASSTLLIASWPNEAEEKRRSSRPQSLGAHQTQVAERARIWATSAGVAPDVEQRLVTSARWHDEGKNLPSFQRYLGNRMVDEPWGKSSRGRASLAADRRHAMRAQHPWGWRHEGLSAALCAAGGHDDLTVHLVGSHHGRCRPLLGSPVAGDGQVDPEHRARDFEDLNRTWGPWGLAYLEALLRLSDWAASAAEPAETVSDRPTGTAPARTPRLRIAETCLTGLVTTPMTGGFAVLGLLRACEELGDDSARVSWPEGEHRPPVWSARTPLAEVVAGACDSPQWDLLDRIGARLDDGFVHKDQKLRPLDGVREATSEAEAADVWLALGLLQDAVIDKGNAPCPIPALSLNSTYIKVALEAVKKGAVSVTADALLDPLAGWAVGKCDGGMDRPRDGGVTGREQEGARMIRVGLAPLALLGMASPGVGGLGGVGVDDHDRHCRLPHPPYPVDFATLVALTRSGRVLQIPTLERRQVTVSKGMNLWLPETPM